MRRCESTRSWRVRSMDADLPSSRRATQPVPMPTSRRAGQSRRTSSESSRATAYSKGEQSTHCGLPSHEVKVALVLNELRDGDVLECDGRSGVRDGPTLQG